MAKIRLTESHRSFLRALARTVATCDAEIAAEDAAYKQAAPLVKATVAARYPSRDMTVLRKYGVAGPDDCIRLQLTAGGVEEFIFRAKDEAPYAPKSGCYSRMYAADQATTDAVQAWIKARDDFRDTRDTKLSDYDALIAQSQYLEEVEPIWPEAAALRDRVARTLPVILSDEVIARIKADAAARLKAAA